MLGEKNGLPVYYMDHIHWKPYWIERTADEKEPLITKVHAYDKWIFEGGHSRTYSERLARSDTFMGLSVKCDILWIYPDVSDSLVLNLS